MAGRGEGGRDQGRSLHLGRARGCRTQKPKNGWYSVPGAQHFLRILYSRAWGCGLCGLPGPSRGGAAYLTKLTHHARATSLVFPSSSDGIHEVTSHPWGSLTGTGLPHICG